MVSDADIGRTPRRGRHLVRRLGGVFPGIDMGADTARTLAKSVLAGTVAWVLAAHVFHASHATFAAFAAMLLMHQTIAESVEKAVHYTAAVLVGIVLAGLAAWPWGATLWLLPIILLVALLIGRWYRLGGQGFNVTVAAVFAFGVFAKPDPGRTPLALLVDLAGSVILGAAVAVATNLLVAPPLRYRSAADAVQSYCTAVAQLLGDIAGELEHGVPESETARHWRERSDGLPRMAASTRGTIDHAQEGSKLNPRRLVTTRRSTFDGYRVTVQFVERIADQVRLMIAGLTRVSAENRDQQAQRRVFHEQFLRHYAGVLTAVRDAVVAASAFHTVDDLSHGRPLAEEAETCRTALDALGRSADKRSLDLPDHWAIYGALYTDAQRLCEEVEFARDGLEALVRAQ